MARQTPPLAERPEAAQPIQIVVDLNRCQAYAQCCFLAPEVFALHGPEALWYDPAPDPAQRERVLAAAAACPVQAIRVAWSRARSGRRGEASHA
jgi:ferredoxin